MMWLTDIEKNKLGNLIYSCYHYTKDSKDDFRHMYNMNGFEQHEIEMMFYRGGIDNYYKQKKLGNATQKIEVTILNENEYSCSGFVGDEKEMPTLYLIKFTIVELAINGVDLNAFIDKLIEIFGKLIRGECLKEEKEEKGEKKMIKLTEQQIKKIGEIQRMCIEHSIESNDDVDFEFGSAVDFIKADVYKNGWSKKECGYREKEFNDGLYGLDLARFEETDRDGDKHVSHWVKLYMENSGDDLDKALDEFIEELQKVFNS